MQQGKERQDLLSYRHFPSVLLEHFVPEEYIDSIRPAHTFMWTLSWPLSSTGSRLK